MNRSLSALYSVMLIASAFIATVVVPTRVDAGTIYVGIGENDLDPQGPADIMASVGAISPYVPAGNIIAATGAITPATIVANLTAGVGMTKPGDVLIFQYAGHGNPVTDPGDLNDPTIPATSDTGVEVPHADEQIGLMTDLNAGTGVTDDQLTSILAKVPAGATAYAILDSCFSGLAIHSNSGKNGDLATIPIDFTATADQLHCAPGDSLLEPLFVDAFKVVNGEFLDGTGTDATLTESELVAYTQNFTDPDHGAPQISDRNANGNLVVAVVPEPPTLGLIIIVAGLMSLYRVRSGSRT